MNRLGFALVSILAVAVLAIPNTQAHFANASNCSTSSQTGSHHQSRTLTQTGSCAGSAGATASGNSASAGELNGIHGACDTRSASNTGVDVGVDHGTGSSVSCSSHSP